MKKKKSSAKKSLMDIQNQTEETEGIHYAREDRTGYTSRINISSSLMEKIMQKSLDIQKGQGFKIGQMDRVLRNFHLRKREHHVVYGVTRREMSLPIELTRNTVELQLIPREDIQEDIAKMKPEVAETMNWIHIGAIQLVIKSTLTSGIHSPIDIAICDRRIKNSKDCVLGILSGDLYAKQIIGILHPKMSYNLQDTNFSRALTLYQDFKRNDLLGEGDRPYSITYQVSYALSNSHHTELFMGKQFIEIPDIFKKVARAIAPDRVEIPALKGVDIQVGDKEVLPYRQSLRIGSGRLSFQGDRIMSQPYGKNLFQQGQTIKPQLKAAVNLKCPNGWQGVTIRFNNTWENYFPSNALYFLEQTQVGQYKGVLDIGNLTVEILGQAGREVDVLILGRDFLEKYKPWEKKEGGMEITINERKMLI